MGLPKIKIEFFSELKKRNKRNASGIVALILKDSTQTEGVVSYRLGDEVEGWSVENLGYISQAFKGEPREVIAVRVDELSESYDVALNLLKNKRFNYLAIPGNEASEAAAVVAWIKSKRKNDKKTFKAVLPNTDADHEGIINFTATDIVTKDGKEYSTAEYAVRIAGALAGLPYNRSATYLELDDLASVHEINNPDDAVDDGELILINDGRRIKIGRGVNSLTTIEGSKNEEFQSIRVVDVVDMIHDEIYDNFNNNYVGKVPNIYDNQVLFLNEVNIGFNELEGLSLLFPNGENKAEIDVDAQRTAWMAVGEDARDWDDQKIKETPFKRNLFLRGKIRIVDTMEDLDFNIEI